MPKKYKYIGKDKQKQGWIGKKHNLGDYIIYDIDGNNNLGMYIPKELIENEPTLWEEIKEEDVFEKIRGDLRDENHIGYTTTRKYIIKYLGITRDTIRKMCLEEVGGPEWSLSESLIIKLFSDRNLLISNDNK